MNANALQVLFYLNEGLKAASAAQIMANNHNETARRQAALLATAQAEGRDITDEELAAARSWAMEQKRERDEQLAKDRMAGSETHVNPDSHGG